MKNLFLSLALTIAITTLPAQQPAPRPHITGISHVGYFVSDLPRALDFWHGLLGYDEAYTLSKPNTDDTRIAFIKINDHQHVELFNEPPTNPPSMMSHLCFSVDDIEQMRAYLRAHGYDIKPGPATKTRTGDYAFEIKDPNGMLIEFAQSLSTGKEMQAVGKFLPTTRISPRIYHAGYSVGNAEKTVDFYKMLGFTETWRNGPSSKEISWINMKVPDGDDYVELMLFHPPLDPKSLGGKTHLSLAVPDIEKSAAELKSRPAFANYSKPIEIHTGINGKRQLNLFDPDGTRVELMEPTTLAGQPVPSSSAPLPPPAY